MTSENPNQQKAAAKQLQEVPNNSTVYEQLINAIKTYSPGILERFQNPSKTVKQTVSKPVAVTVAVTETVSEAETVAVATPGASSNVESKGIVSNGHGEPLNATECAMAQAQKLHITADKSIEAMRAQIQLEADESGESCEVISEKLGVAIADYEKSKPELDYTVGLEKFVGNGIWRNREGWPWKKRSPSEWKPPPMKPPNVVEELRAAIEREKAKLRES